MPLQISIQGGEGTRLRTLTGVGVTHNVLKLLGLPQLPGEAINEETPAVRAGQHVVADHIKDDTLGREGEAAFGAQGPLTCEVTLASSGVFGGTPTAGVSGSTFFFFFNFIYFWLGWVFVAVRGLLIAVASLVAEHGP